MTRPLWLCAWIFIFLGPAQAAQSSDPEQIARGRYLALAGDCLACHTATGGPEFAGGFPMETPVGRIYSTNITPDHRTGIGEYSFEDFDRAVRAGVAKDGHHLYPAMPYPSYAKVTDDDMRAMYAYFQNGVPPVDRANRPSQIPWLLSFRWPFAFWNWAFLRREPFRPSPDHDATWNRGAYLVQGLGHCGACHTPRGVAFQEKALTESDGPAYLSGADIDGWYAKNLRGNDADGLENWNAADLGDYLKTGRTDRSAAFGGMTEVIQYSTQHLSDGDLAAVAEYLKSLPSRKGVPESGRAMADSATFESLRAGKTGQVGTAVYEEFCVACHRADGAGVAKIFPALAGNSVVTTEDATSLIRIVLAGGRMPKTDNYALAYAMPAFDQLNDRDVADVVTFMRKGWGNRANPVSTKEVADVRATLRPVEENR
jgi:mono/diheme cytochrome c family protein